MRWRKWYSDQPAPCLYTRNNKEEEREWAGGKRAKEHFICHARKHNGAEQPKGRRKKKTIALEWEDWAILIPGVLGEGCYGLVVKGLQETYQTGQDCVVMIGYPGNQYIMTQSS